MKKLLLLLLPILTLTLLFSPTADAQDRRGGRDRDDGYDRVYRNQRGKRNFNDGYDRAYNRRRGFERRDYRGRSRYYRDGRYYYRGGNGYYPYGSRRGDGGISIRF